MNTTVVRKWLRKYGVAGVLLAGIYLLLHLLRNGKRPVLFLGAISAITALVLLGFGRLHSTEPGHDVKHRDRRQASMDQSILSSAPSENPSKFRLDYRLPTSQEGNSVAVVGLWQGNERLPRRSALWALDPFTGNTQRLYAGPLLTYRVIGNPAGGRSRSPATTSSTRGKIPPCPCGSRTRRRGASARWSLP
jgi:hypothetical protein